MLVIRIKRPGFVYLILLFISFFGCERNEDALTEPEILVQVPSENDVFSVFDTIWIKATVKHISDIRNISLSVTDADLKPVISSKSIITKGSEIKIDTFLVVNNKYIDETLNYLHIEIEDSENLFNHWTAINIIPLSRHLEKLMFVSGANAVNNLYTIEESTEMLKIATWDSDYLGGFVDSKYNLFYTSGSVSDGIRCYNLEENSLLWKVPVQPTGSIPYFNSFHAFNGRISVGLWDGSLNSFDQNGVKVFASSKLQNGRISEILNLDKYIAGIFTPFNGGTNQLMIYNYPAGNIYHSMILEGRPIGLFPVDDKTFLLISEVNGLTKAYYYKPEEKTLNFHHNVTSLTVNKAEGDGRDMFLVTNDAILWYRPEINSTVPYIYMLNQGSLIFEPEDKVLYVTSGNQIIAYKLPSSTPYKTYNTEETVKDILLLYNK